MMNMDFPDKRLLMTNMDLTDTILLGQDKNSNIKNSDDLNSNDAVDERFTKIQAPIKQGKGSRCRKRKYSNSKRR